MEEPIDDEALVPPYELPDPLVSDGGRPVVDAGGWRARRAELLEHFAREVYGRTPYDGEHFTDAADRLVG